MPSTLCRRSYRRAFGVNVGHSLCGTAVAVDRGGRPRDERPKNCRPWLSQMRRPYRRDGNAMRSATMANTKAWPRAKVTADRRTTPVTTEDNPERSEPLDGLADQCLQF